MATKEITSENFKSTVEQNGIVLLDFWAEWCGPCKRFGPIFEQVSEKYENYTFGKVDTEANQELSAALQVQSIPTLMMFRDGVLLAREAGLMPPQALEDLIAQAEALNMDDVRAQIAEQQAGQEEQG
ncbi:thioredoxin [Corynebacterium heidelbergense]|uniref:Thioredoxin n=1 Tax=Corynebacterium heidelbergense TaxID=2055947 RepID=A0A364V964_9CORY|nr:thioredoxin [Corynebacterium heidelbergense]RAV33200.1 thioredoxin [Corynebacterium heidelbergense]WCZ37577.1 Putative thioredoxin-2 [Corynebacterium heidelbergense]